MNFERTFADQVFLTELYTIQGLSRYRTYILQICSIFKSSHLNIITFQNIQAKGERMKGSSSIIQNNNNNNKNYKYIWNCFKGNTGKLLTDWMELIWGFPSAHTDTVLNGEANMHLVSIYYLQEYDHISN